MTKELQSSRYIVISFLVREMGFDIVEAISLMAELEKKWLGSLGIKWRFNTQKNLEESYETNYRKSIPNFRTVL